MDTGRRSAGPLADTALSVTHVSGASTMLVSRQGPACLLRRAVVCGGRLARLPAPVRLRKQQQRHHHSRRGSRGSSPSTWASWRSRCWARLPPISTATHRCVFRRSRCLNPSSIQEANVGQSGSHLEALSGVHRRAACLTGYGACMHFRPRLIPLSA